MNEKTDFNFTWQTLAYPLGTVLLMWVVFWYELRFHQDFTNFGIYPQRWGGLVGVVCGPFIHGSVGHLYNNSIPFLVLMGGLFYFYRPVAWKVFFCLLLISGLGTWSIGREAYHIGASGMVYAMASFLFFKGIWSRHYRLTAFSLIVIFLYGSLLWGTLPLDGARSWEGHLSGFIGGIIMALLIKKQIPKPVKYIWQHNDYEEANDPFLKQFDANGNFMDLVDEGDTDDIENTVPSPKDFEDNTL